MRYSPLERPRAGRAFRCHRRDLCPFVPNRRHVRARRSARFPRSERLPGEQPQRWAPTQLTDSEPTATSSSSRKTAAKPGLFAAYRADAEARAKLAELGEEAMLDDLPRRPRWAEPGSVTLPRLCFRWLETDFRGDWTVAEVGTLAAVLSSFETGTSPIRDADFEEQDGKKVLVVSDPPMFRGRNGGRAALGSDLVARRLRVRCSGGLRFCPLSLTQKATGAVTSWKRYLYDRLVFAEPFEPGLASEIVDALPGTPMLITVAGTSWPNFKCDVALLVP